MISNKNNLFYHFKTVNIWYQMLLYQFTMINVKYAYMTWACVNWYNTETEMLPFWWHFRHWLHWKLSLWQLSVQPVMKISSKWWHFCFSAISKQHCYGIQKQHWPSTKAILTQHKSDTDPVQKRFRPGTIAILSRYKSDTVWYRF